MKLLHWLRRQESGMAVSTFELAKYEARAGHEVCIRQPSDGAVLYGEEFEPDIHLIHSQIPPALLYERTPLVKWIHDEPLLAAARGGPMRALCEMAPRVDAFICMRQDELAIWNSIRRTHLVTRGVDLEKYKPAEGPVEKLAGDPAILYLENWRGVRNPLYWCVAMMEGWRSLPDARLHLYNAPQGALETFSALYQTCGWAPFVPTLHGPVDDPVSLMQRADIIVSGLYPLHARTGAESLACGKAFLGPGYREEGYPYTFELDPRCMSAALVKVWEERGKFDFRAWAEEHHDVKRTVEESMAIYERLM